MLKLMRASTSSPTIASIRTPSRYERSPTLAGTGPDCNEPIRNPSTTALWIGTCWPKATSCDDSVFRRSFRAILLSTTLGIVPVSIRRLRPFSAPMDPFVTTR